MPGFAQRIRVFSLLAFCTLTVGVTRANANSVNLLGGGTITGGAVYVLTGGTIGLGNAFSVCNTAFCPANPWLITSTTGANWSNSNIAGQRNQDLAFGGPLVLSLTDSQNNTLNLVLSTSYAQFVQNLQTLPFGQTFQVPLVTNFNAVACFTGSTCSEEVDSGQVFNALLITGPAYLSVTNDPGFFQTTLTSVPLNQTPEPSSLLLLGSGLLGLGPLVRRRLRPTS